MGENSQLDKEFIDACLNGPLRRAKELIKDGANLNARTDDGFSILNTVCHSYINYTKDLKLLDLVKLLIENGADVNSKSPSGDTPLGYIAYARPMYLATLHLLEVTRYLLDNGADPNSSNAGGTPLYMASYRGHTRIVKLLVERGADPAKGYGRYELAQIAARRLFFSVVVFLCRRGGDCEKAIITGLLAILLRLAIIGSVAYLVYGDVLRLGFALRVSLKDVTFPSLMTLYAIHIILQAIGIRRF